MEELKTVDLMNDEAVEEVEETSNIRRKKLFLQNIIKSWMQTSKKLKNKLIVKNIEKVNSICR